MSALQRRIWREFQLSADRPCARPSILQIRMSGALDLAALRLSVSDLATRHDALKATVSPDGNTLRIHQDAELVPTIHDWSTHEANSNGIDDAAVRTLLGLPFELTSGPLIRCDLFQTSPDQHLLIFLAHPIICDGWSLGVLCEDLAASYKAHLGKTTSHHDVAPSFAAYLAGRDVTDNGYWQDQLNTTVPSLDLPIDRAREASQLALVGYRCSRIDAALVQELKSTASQTGASLFTTLAASFCAQLGRLSQAEKVALSVATAGQLSDGLEHMVGQCSQWLPVQIAVQPDLTGLQLLQQAQATVLDAYDHQNCDIEAILLGLLPVSMVATKIGFNLDPDPNNARTRFAPLQAQVVAAANVPVALELFLNATMDANGIQLDCRYDATLFDAGTIDCWLGMYVAFLRRLAADPRRAIAELATSPTEELARIKEWNSTTVKYTSEICVQQLFENQVALTPDSIAVSHGVASLSYATLNARANQLAHHLRTIGIKPDSRVAICIERNPEMVVAVIAVLKAGAAYLPLDPAYPADRLAHMLADGAPTALLMQKSLAAVLEGIVPPTVRVLDIHHDSEAWSKASTENLPIVPFGLSEASLAYVIYTSGSTGMPKGVAMPHRALVNLLHWQLSQPGFKKLKRTLQFAALGFDVAFQETFSTLGSGGELVLIDEEVRFNPAELFRFVVSRRVERVFLPYVALQLLADGFATVSESAPGSEPLACDLREVITAGEQVRVDARILDFFAKLGNVRLINHYGPTESHVVTCHWLPAAVADWPVLPPIGAPIANSRVYILDEHRSPAPIGVPGELYIAGICVASGYLNRPDLTNERFLPDPFTAEPGASMYKTGDLARWRSDGIIDYLGRNDFQVKIRGFRVELGEIETRIANFSGVRDVAVVAREDTPGVKRLVAYYTAKGVDIRIGAEALRSQLSTLLPDYMMPAAFIQLDQMPVTPNGKLDRRGLPAPGTARPELSTPYQAPAGDHEIACCAAFATVLGLDEIGRGDNFFELGGSSILAIKLLEEIKKLTGAELSVPLLFARPTPAGLATELDGVFGIAPENNSHSTTSDAWTVNAEREELSRHTPIAIIGMSGRFPGAKSIEELWENLLAGRDAITQFTDQSLDPAVSAALRSDPNYVRARGIISGTEEFDAAFFGISPREAEVMDPQHRIFLEIAWECLERAGYAPDRTDCPVGVFAGTHTPSYLRNHVLNHPEAIERLGDFQVMVGNDKDYVASRVAYKLNLKGPAVAVNTACSTSLVAVSQAVDSLRAGRCAMALAGGASITSPYRSGYLYQDGAMLSVDGHTRSFDAEATGTAFNDGAAVILLKRLDDAVADGDQIIAVIRGTATNNDGGGKASFTAPSVDGQAAVIAAAHLDANVDPSSISYVEAHGTATPLGDPIEIEALTRAFRRGMTAHGSNEKKETGFCRIGSIKSNIGHLISASGAVGVIKTALALKAEMLPATIHFTKPNPKINFADSPFVVNTTASPWPRSSTPRRAGVSSFGVGGTNAHAVLEEAPVQVVSRSEKSVQLLRLSARSPQALAAMTDNLMQHLSAHPTLNLSNVAFTLDVGRSLFPHRLTVACDSIASAIDALKAKDNPYRAQREVPSHKLDTVFVFPGQGAQYAGMGRTLYEMEPTFRAAYDECLAALAGHIGFDLKKMVFSGAAETLEATEVTQPATFCLEYSLARWWMYRGLKPSLLIGHSVGEFVAAVIAGVMTLEDALRLVARRGALMQSLPAGSMLSVRLSADKLEPLIPKALSLAAQNGPAACVVAGPTDILDAFAASLEKDGVVTRALRTSHAFHSSMMTPAIAPFHELVQAIKLSPPAIPVVSTLTGKRMQAGDATDPGYWSRHLREPVRFSPAIRNAISSKNGANLIFLEIGPRGTLSSLIRQHTAAGTPSPLAIPSLSDTAESELLSIQAASGQLWTLGIELKRVYTAERKYRRVLLPTYPFERKRHWLEALSAAIFPSLATATLPAAAVANVSDISPTIPAMTNPPPSRRSRLVGQLRELFEDVAGADLSSADPATSFIEMGLDSLTLTQAAIQLKKSFAVKITFRQLMESYRSFESLAEYLDGALPPETATPTAAAAVPVAGISASAVATPAISLPLPMTPGSSGLVQQVIQQQMQLMAQQLALLGVAGPAPTNSHAVPSSLANNPSLAAAESAAGEEAVKAVTYDVKKAFGAIARIHTQGSALTDRQRARLDAFIRRYVERTRKSKEYTTRHREHLADPRVVNNFRPQTKEIIYQVVVDKSKGPRVWDIDGNEYVDALNGFGMSLFGWQPDFIQDVIKQQLESGYEIGPMHPLAGEVAKLICELTGFDRAGLCNTGSEAVMAAIRIARTVTGRSLMVVFTGSYHGTFDEVIVRAGRKHKGIPAAPGIMSEAFGNILVLDYGTPESLEIIREYADELAAVLVEPVQSRRPDFQPKEFLQQVREITEKSGTCLIFDEVITGFRSHPGGVQALFGIRADLASYGKVIGGGYPIGVVAGKREYMDALDGGAWQYGDDSIPTVGVTYFAGTFVRHPLALAAAKASLEYMKAQGPQLQADLNLRTAAMADELNAFCIEAGAPVVVKTFASLWRATFNEDHVLQDLLFAMMRSRGVHILDNFPCFFTTAHTPADIAVVKKAFKESILELQEADLLPRRKDETAAALDASKPPVPGARLGKDAEGRPAWFVPNPDAPGKYLRLDS